MTKENTMKDIQKMMNMMILKIVRNIMKNKEES